MMLRCLRDSSNGTVPANTLGREHGGGSISFALTRHPKDLPGFPGFLALHSHELGFRCFGVFLLPSMGVFLAVFDTNRVGDAGCSDLRTGSRRDRGVQTRAGPLLWNMGAWLARSIILCGHCIGVFQPCGEASVGTGTAKR